MTNAEIKFWNKEIPALMTETVWKNGIKYRAFTPKELADFLQEIAMCDFENLEKEVIINPKDNKITAIKYSIKGQNVLTLNDKVGYRGYPLETLIAKN